MRSFSILLFVLTLIFCLCSDASADTYHVATTGNNNNPGTSTQPWQTLQHAVDTILPGDTILVQSGTYVGCRIERSGQPNAPCTLKAATGAQVLVNAASPDNRHNSNIEVENFDETIKYWVIDGFEVADGLRYGIDLRDTDFITVQNCFVHNSVVTGIFLAFSYHPLIQNNESANNGEHGIYQSNSGDFPTIRGNRLHHNVGAGLHMNGDRNFTPGDGIISFALVEKNVVYENGTGGGSGINCDGVHDSRISNNLLYNNHASGISLYAADGSEGSSRNKVYNNTIVMASNGRWCINIPPSSEGQSDPVGNIVKNNILYTAHSFRGSISTYSSAASGFASDYNVIVNRFSIDDGGTNMSLPQWQAFGYDLHSFVATPSALFVDPAANNYHLKSGSPAVNAGTPLIEVIDDLDGLSRPQGSALDVGCFELAQCASSLSPQGAPFTSSGGTGSVSVATPDGCSWMAVSNAGFINITSGSSGTGNGTINYSVAANSACTQRTGTMTIAGQTFTVMQAAASCRFTIGLYNPTTSAFFLRNTNSTGIADLSFAYGPAAVGWIPLAGDWDGDGDDTVGLYNPSTGAFFLRNSNSTGVADVSFSYGPGGLGWIPLVGDWNGDGTDTVGLYSPAGGAFFLRNSNSTGVADVMLSYGPAGAGWMPIVGDWNNDGTDTIGLYNPTAGTFFLKNTNSSGVADVSFAYGPGGAGWKPLVGDWNGDATDTIGLYNPSASAFFLRNTNTTGVADVSFAYGPAGAGWIPLIGNWDGN